MSKQLTQLGKDLEFVAEVLEDFSMKYPNIYLSVTHCEKAEIAWISTSAGRDINIWLDKKMVDMPSEYYE